MKKKGEGTKARKGEGKMATSTCNKQHATGRQAMKIMIGD
jgi:hypothetical protein